jgi:predicted RNA-binding Zn ribbon-like protein
MPVQPATAIAAPRPLPVVGGHLCLDFANTVDHPEGPTRWDHISTYDDLLDWSRAAGTITQQQADQLGQCAARDAGEADAALQSAHQLRDVLNDVFGAVVDRPEQVAAHWVRLRSFVTAAAASTEVDITSRPPRWTWTGVGDLVVVMHPVAAAAADLLGSEDLSRLKRCPGCSWLFLDRSRNHSRRWCDMGDCGTVAKSRRYVTRRSAARRAGSPGQADVITPTPGTTAATAGAIGDRIRG